MKETNTLIIGAGISGLACAAALQKHSVKYLLIEREAQVATPWRNHYERLHLHTNKRISSLPYLKFPGNIPQYPNRQQVVDYLDEYRRKFDIKPLFNTEAKSVRRSGEHWITETNNESYQSKYVVVATGPFGKPKPIQFKGMETFPGRILHSYEYKSGKDFKGQRVLVVGFGNSACEIAIDLYEQQALASMSVRSPVNVIPRDLMGIPILEISLLMSRLPARIADTINAPLMRLLFGDLRKLGLKKLPYGPFEQIQKDGRIPVLDIGTIRHIRKGHIRVFDGIDRIEGSAIHFVDGKVEEFDAVIASIGYYSDCEKIIKVDANRFGDLKQPVDKQKFFGDAGLYFCGFYIGPTGQIREIASDAKKIAGDICSRKRDEDADFASTQ
jgi:cation diffusion facilitator CzcD-associated flavoprotein CzcO